LVKKEKKKGKGHRQMQDNFVPQRNTISKGKRGPLLSLTRSDGGRKKKKKNQKLKENFGWNSVGGGGKCPRGKRFFNFRKRTTGKVKLRKGDARPWNTYNRGREEIGPPPPRERKKRGKRRKVVSRPR